MSEYQYFEFLTIDRPLSRQQQAEVRALSSRAHITSTRFVNEYHWGDFKGDPNRLMERYYDAHLYLATWGTQRVMFRLSRHLLAWNVVADFVVDDGLNAWTAGDSIIVDFLSEAEPAEFEFEFDPRSSLADLVGVRAELAAGDLRPLYLGWLAAFGDPSGGDDVADAVLEPPVPSGLADLTPAQSALAEYLRVDEHLLAVAAVASRPLDDGAAERDLATWVAGLPVAEKNRVLESVAQGEGDRMRMELLRGFHAASGSSATSPARRTLGELRDAADVQRADRERKLAARRAEDKARRELAIAAARDARLDDLAGREDAAWERVDGLIATRKPADYDVAVSLLGDLHALAEREQRAEPFATRLVELKRLHERKTSLVERLNRAGL